MFLKISQNLQENTCARVSLLIKLQRPTALSKKILWHRCFPVNFVKFLRTTNFIGHLLASASECSLLSVNKTLRYTHANYMKTNI